MTIPTVWFYDRRISHDVISPATLMVGGKKISRGRRDLCSALKKYALIKEGAEKISKLDCANFWHRGQS